ncbi:MAG: hypothetical protein K2X99_08060, partial [Gemmatimonadaceae bacterium]|nr:hypothetical protein [Gemmatimonadaceae bacterium]
VGVQRISAINGGPSFGLLLGLSTTLPFTAARANALAGEAMDADVVAAATAVGAAVARRRQGLDALYERYLAARARLSAIDGVLQVAADAERDAALAEFRSGALTLLELLDLERALLAVELERSEALRAAAASRAALLGATTSASGDHT